MKKLLSVLLACAMTLPMLAGCGSTTEEPEVDVKEKVEATGQVYNVCNLVNGNLGDKSFFDSAEAGLTKLKKEGKIERDIPNLLLQPKHSSQANS